MPIPSSIVPPIFNKEHHDLVYDSFKTLDNIFETHMVFDKMFVVLEDLVEKRKHFEEDLIQGRKKCQELKF